MTDKKWTLYSLNWLPLWWFVKLTWENPNNFLVYDKKGKLYDNEELEKAIEKDKDVFDKSKQKLTKDDKEEILKKLEENKAPYNLSNKPAPQQAIVILAWAFMNFVLAIVIFSFLFFIGVKPIWINDQIKIDSEIKTMPTKEQALDSWLLIENPWVILTPVKDSVAEKAGIQVWDVLIGVWLIDNPNLNSFPYIRERGYNGMLINKSEELMEIISSNAWEELIFNILRDGKEIDIKVIPSDEGKIWSYLWSYLWDNIVKNEDFKVEYGFFSSIKYGTLETYNYSVLTLKWIWTLGSKLFNPKTETDRKEAISQVSWPIWIVNVITDTMSQWIIFLLIFWAIISLSLWVFNLLPIPALDGGRFFFIVVNGFIRLISGKKWISPFVESIIHAGFFLMLIILSFLVAYNDILRIVSE